MGCCVPPSRCLCVGGSVCACRYDLVVIGAGVAGLLSVIMGNALGKKCVLIEKHYMGGDCLNVGCFPSKAVIECARRVHEVRNSAEMGVKIEGRCTQACIAALRI